MRKPHHFTVVLCVLFCALGLLLLLSTLVEAPADAAPSALGEPAASAQFLPALPLVPETVAGNRWLSEFCQAVAYVCVALLPLAHTALCSDANGRVLRKRRYVQSYHPVFKQELACG